ncbi:Wzz/FepE/Etk N-terminal domain-containing protein [Mesobacillus sp. AQ2]|uniref:YveK family protein n=1 Tax=Mesobacillus sp. AQ2 TaxID=3043332 RepID=UPI0024C1B996|nr:Wzz/FepE/Etk N-terminal domain-containing protein [Mesobacillus sp. AQ2]WHX40394.1 Wzz/FepE/Etk N-terminal domain-containing protein [Mesobacillus sp. AQ2]
MEETISLKDLFETLKKRLLLILAITLTAVMVSGIVSFFFLTPIYQASTQILVNKSNSDQVNYNPAELQTSLQLINTYMVIIKSPAILDKVIDEMDLDITSAQLSEKITVGSEKDSQVMNISVQDEDANRAAALANKIAEVFKEENIMKVDNISILANAQVTDGQSPIKPQPVLNIAIALVVGLMAGIGLAFLLEYLDNTVKNEQDVEKNLELPILGVISVIEDAKMEEMKRRRTDRKTRSRGESFGS